jgi:hypothetical protein
MSTPSLLAIFFELRRADPAHASFVFLHLMKGEAEVTGQLCLRDACFPATQTDSPPDLDVRDPGRSWVEPGRTRFRFGLPAHWEIILQPKARQGRPWGLLFYLCPLLAFALGSDLSGRGSSPQLLPPSGQSRRGLTL